MEEEKMIKKENEITNMNDAKNKNGIIAVLIVIIIALIGVVVYFAFIKKDDKPVDNNGGNNQVVDNGTSQVDDSSNYDAWMNYLLKQNIIEITYERGWNYETDDGYYPVKKVSLETLKAFFKEFKSHNYKLIKENVQGRGDGANYINITYVKNGVEYKLSLDDAYWTEGNNDDEFMKALESMGYKEEGFEGYPLSSIWYIFRDEIEDENTDINRFDKYYAKFFK